MIWKERSQRGMLLLLLGASLRGEKEQNISSQQTSNKIDQSPTFRQIFSKNYSLQNMVISRFSNPPLILTMPGFWKHLILRSLFLHKPWIMVTQAVAFLKNYLFLSRKFTNARSQKALKVFFAFPKSLLLTSGKQSHIKFLVTPAFWSPVATADSRRLAVVDLCLVVWAIFFDKFITTSISLLSINCAPVHNTQPHDKKITETN